MAGEGQISARLLPAQASFDVENDQRRDHLERRWSSTLLLVGSICGFLAFALATLVGIFKNFSSDDRPVCFLGTLCPSGKHYHVETVSELVSEPGSPPSKLFVCFTTCGSMLLLMSKYPFELRNVAVEPSRRGLLNLNGIISLNALRAVLPPLGMMTVASVAVVPRVERLSTAITVACSVHSMGAVCFVLGYLLLELATLYFINKRPSCPLFTTQTGFRIERTLRWTFVACGLICTIAFVVCGNALAFADDLNICCADKYIKTTEAVSEHYNFADNTTAEAKAILDLAVAQYGTMALVDSAKGFALGLKKIEFWAETLAGVFIIASHIVIWLFAAERDISTSEP